MLVNTAYIKPAWIITAIGVLGAVLYIGERLYVTPAEAVDNTLERAMTALTNKNIDQFNQQLHEALFDVPPPAQVKPLLPQEARSTNQWSRAQFTRALRDVLERTTIQRYVIMKKDIAVRDDHASVQTQVLVFYQDESNDYESKKEGLLPSTFLSSWTIGFTREEDGWKINELNPV